MCLVYITCLKNTFVCEIFVIILNLLQYLNNCFDKIQNFDR